MKEKHKKYSLKDQASGRCPYCLASAEIDCGCENENLCGKPHNNGEASCLECEIIKKNI